MTTVAPALDWKPLPGTGVYVATIACNTTDTWLINLRSGNLPLEMRSRPPRYMIVDNFANNAQCQVFIGGTSGIPYSVPIFTRKTFELYPDLSVVAITPGSGTVSVYILQSLGLTPDGANDYAIQQAAAQFVTYPFVSKLSTQAQIASDQNKNILLSNAAAQSYTLLGIAANSIPNGWFNPIVKNVGAGRWTIQPAVGNTINTDYTNANPLLMSQNDNISLSCDGVQWYASGRISFTSAQQTFTGGASVTVAHGLVRAPKPSEIEVWLECVTANVGYSVGDKVKMPTNSDNTSRLSLCSAVADGTNINMYFNTSTPDIMNKSTFARTVITNANWRVVAKAWVDL